MVRMLQTKGTNWGVWLIALLLVPSIMLSGCSKPDDSKKKDEEKKTSQASKEKLPPTSAKKLDTGRAVLEAMAQAYRKAKSYRDKGTVSLLAQSGDQKFPPEIYDFSVAFERPNKFHLDAYNAKIRCDGQKFHAFISDLPGQILEKDAPAQLDTRSIYSDLMLVQVMRQGRAGATPQTLLLLEDKALDYLLQGAEEPTLSESGEVDGRKCYRVQVKRPDGMTTFWIDEESLVLRRVVFPPDVLRMQMARELGGTVDSVSLIADFVGAELNKPVDPKAFQFEMPTDTKYETVSLFNPPHPGQLMGKKSPNYKFTDLEGKVITPQSLEGKIVAFFFWSAKYSDYRQGLLGFQKLFETYRDNPKVAICAISLDDETVTDTELANLRKSLNLELPIYRNRDKTAIDFKIIDLPSMYLAGPDGTMQDYGYPGTGDWGAVLPKKIESLLAGENIAEDAVRRYQEEFKEYEKRVKSLASGEEPSLPQAKVAEKSAPKHLKLSPLWKCTEFQSPNNILVLNEPKKPPRLLVADTPNLVKEIGLDGKVKAVHPLELAEGEMIANLRAFTSPEGKTWIAAFTIGLQRLHLFNLEDKQVMSYPQDALQNPHSGIADVELFDMDNNGTPEIYVGYWGVVGVHAVSLEGKLLWNDRSLANVTRIAATPRDANGESKLICVNFIDDQTSSLVVFDARGKRQGEFSLEKRNIRSLLGYDLLGDGNWQWCGLGFSNQGELLGLGFNLQGQELWSYKLPTEIQTRPIEQIVAGRLATQGPGQWILPGPDGSIHILSPEGKTLDAFNYGTLLQGIATTEINGKPVLLISTINGLEAFTVE